MPDSSVPSALGPKCDCAYGEYEGPQTQDSAFPPAVRRRGTTALHVDMADAVNVLVHVDGTGSGLEDGIEVFGEKVESSFGAVWHIFSEVASSK